MNGGCSTLVVRVVVVREKGVRSSPSALLKMVSIRKAKKEDFEGIFGLIRELWPSEKFNESKLRKVYINQLDNGKIFLIAKKKGDAIGFISLCVKYDLQNQGKIGNVDEFVVGKTFRKKGVGKILLKEINKVAKKSGCLELQLNSSKKRKEAHAFYIGNRFNKSGFFFWRAVK